MPTISNLPAATQVNSPDLFPIVQAGVTKKATIAMIITATQTGLIITESQVTGLTADLAARLIAANNLSDLTNIPLALNNLGLPTLTNGQVWIGSTGFNPVNATLTAGTGVSIVNAAGSVTINASGGGVSWTTVTGTTQAAAINNGYVANSNAVGACVITLPAIAPVGSIVEVLGLGNEGWTLAANAGQTIQFGSVATSTAGSFSSTNQFDTILVKCMVANTTWSVTSSVSAGLTRA